ncbi:hypothetical protein [Oryzobacter telluris]|uniref:aggregation-promoting factor C-terminal-like domain-containing protein n=1 Tax=Oryzobacter telluris TaxID=3149179 RepID=UPI00370DC7C7
MNDPGWRLPSASDVADAKDAAAAAAKEVAAITAKVERAKARLEALQRGIAEAVSAQQVAEQRLADARTAVQQATVDLAAARAAREDADRDLSGTAALMYMSGGELQNMGTLVLSPPNVMSDLVVVLDQNAYDASQDLDVAKAAAADAANQERFLLFTRDTQASALEDLGRKRAATEKAAAQAGAEAAKLGKQQEELTARLAGLDATAAILAGTREAAARFGLTSMIGLQASGPEPRKAQEIARSMMPERGWDAAEFTCLVALWNAESGWSWSATNSSSGAYGIPQALPGWKMASAGNDWLTNPATQITWGLGYIDDVYGSPCNAYEKFLSRSPHWY